jgi:hypothetical protein
LSLPTRFNRREFLIQTSAISAAAILPLAVANAAPTHLFAQAGAASATEIDPAKINESAPKIPSRDTLLKFNPDGTRRPFAGNTVICHLPIQSVMRNAMVDLHDELTRASYFSKLGLTSTDSYHMTIFPGANDQDRNISGWPSYVPADAPIEVCSRMVGERMAKAHLNCELPLRVRIDQPRTLTNPTACTLRMLPVDDVENTKLRSIRDRLAKVYGFRLKDHDQYGFHITMSYQIAPFTNQEQAAYRSLLKLHIQRIIDAAPVLELGNPEYCTFPDMFRFDTQKLIACS